MSGKDGQTGKGELFLNLFSAVAFGFAGGDFFCRQKKTAPRAQRGAAFMLLGISAANYFALAASAS